MRFHKLLAAIVLATVLLLTGCVKNSNPDAEKSTRVKYAKVYNPDGTLLVEGECSKARSGRHYGYASIEIDGVTYDTGLDNVIVISWYE
jgi:hypothetical protein